MIRAEQIERTREPLVVVLLLNLDRESTPAFAMRRSPVMPVPMWYDSSRSIGPIDAASGAKLECESIVS